MTVNYDDYIHSEEWAEKSEAAKERAGYRCQVCNVPDSMAGLETHHRTYERLGYEDDGDLIVLCGDCHSIYEQHHRMQNPGQRRPMMQLVSWRKKKRTFEPPVLSADLKRRMEENRAKRGY